MIGHKVTVTIDRPLGSTHPRYHDMIYPINYGYVEGIFASDGYEQDAYILGIDIPLATFSGIVIAVIHRYDDIEEKWVVAPANKLFTIEDIRKATEFTEKYFDIDIRMK